MKARYACGSSLIVAHPVLVLYPIGLSGYDVVATHLVHCVASLGARQLEQLAWHGWQ